MNLAQRAIRGMMWAYSTFFGGKFITLIVTAILARLLGVDDFGLWGIALLLLTYIDATRDFGINDALIYNTDDEEDTATTAFWLNIAIGIGQFLVMFFLAPLARHIPTEGAANINAADIVPVIQVIGFVFIINALGNTHDGLLQKRLEFRKRYLPEFYSAIIKGVITVLLALWLRNVWALVIGQLIGAVVRTITRWWLMPFRPKFVFYPARARALWDYGIHVLMFSIISIALDQADQSVIAALIGVIQIGYFTIGARLPEMVISNFSLVLTRVLFPVFTRLKDDRAALTDAFLATTRYTVFITVPAGFGMAAVAPELVILLFGEKWIPAIGLLQTLALLQMAFTLPWTAGDMFKASGRPDIQTKLLLWEALYTFPMIIAAALITREAFWASTANMIAALITAVVRLWLAARFLQFPVQHYLGVFRTAFIGGGIMLAAVIGTRWLTSPLPIVVTTSRSDLVLTTHTPLFELPMLATLALSILVGMAVYVPLLWAMERENLRAAADLIKGSLRKDNES